MNEASAISSTIASLCPADGDRRAAPGVDQGPGSTPMDRVPEMSGYISLLRRGHDFGCRY